MRRRLPLFVLLASALTLIASLYLSWRAPLNAPGDLTGWTAPSGYAAALLAVAVTVAATVALIRPSRAARLPLGGLGVALAYFAAAVAVELTAFAFPIGTYPGPRGWTGYGHLHWAWASGFYLGATSGAVAALAGLALRGKELRSLRASADITAAVLGLGLLASFLLPWQQEPGGSPVIGLDSPAATIAAAGLLLGAGRLRRTESQPRLAILLMVAVLTGAAASGVTIVGTTAYGTWLGVGCAVALVALEPARARTHLRPPELHWRRTALRSGAAVLLLVALFLPWQRSGPQHFSWNGWQWSFGAASAALAMLLLAAPLLPWVARYAAEAAVGIACLVATIGISVVHGATDFFHPAYGLCVGLVAAALLLLGVLTPLERPTVDRRRALVRAVPVLATLASIGAVLVPAWQGVLPVLWTAEASAVRSWFAVATLLLALHLLRLWIRRIGPEAPPSRSLIVIPALILPLPALELMIDRSSVAWGGVILVSLCLLLAALGWIEQRGGMERLGFPEMLRVDRLPEPES